MYVNSLMTARHDEGRVVYSDRQLVVTPLHLRNKLLLLTLRLLGGHVGHWDLYCHTIICHAVLLLLDCDDLFVILSFNFFFCVQQL